MSSVRGPGPHGAGVSRARRPDREKTNHDRLCRHTNARGAGCLDRLRRPRTAARRGRDRAAAVHRPAHGRVRLRHPRVVPHRPDGGDVRPSWAGSQHPQRRVDREPPRAAGRRPAPADRGAGRRTGRRVRQQRRRGRRAVPRRPAPARRADARRARAALDPDAPRRRGGARRRAARRGDVSDPRLGYGDGDVHRPRVVAGRAHRGVRQRGPRPGPVRAADGGRRFARRPAAVRRLRGGHRLPSRPRCAAGRADARRHRGGRAERRGAHAPRGRVDRRGSGAECVLFPGDHGGFAGDEYGMRGEPEAFAARLREVLDET